MANEPSKLETLESVVQTASGRIPKTMNKVTTKDLTVQAATLNKFCQLVMHSTQVDDLSRISPSDKDLLAASIYQSLECAKEALLIIKQYH